MTPLDRLYAALVRAMLPAWLRHRVGDDLCATFADRIADAGSPAARWREVARELAGLAHVAVAARMRRPLHPAVPPTLERRPPMLDGLRQDLTFAMRAMRRDRLVAVLGTLTLAVGIGMSTAMFSAIDAVLLRPLPFERPEQIVFVNPTIEEWRTNPSLHDMWQRGRFSLPELREWLAGQRSFEAAGGYRVRQARVPSGAGSERIPFAEATSGVWAALRVRPLLGRLTMADERDSVAVVTYAFWRTRLGGDPAAVGRDIRLDDRPVRVVGVLPERFALLGVTVDLWRPLALAPGMAGFNDHGLAAVGRLRDGVSLAHAEQEVGRLVRAVDAGDVGHNTHGGHLVAPVQQATSELRAPLLILAAASVLLLAAACANVTLLLLGAGADRLRELAVRRALGAGRGRIARQLVVESVVLGVAGAALGMGITSVAVRLLVAMMPAGVPRIASVAVDLRTFGVAALLAGATGVLVGCIPALSLSRVNATEALRAGATARGTGRLQHAIVIAELALATVLVVGAGLLTRTMGELQRVRPGFAADGLFTVQLVLPWDHFYRPGVANDSAQAAMASYVGQLVEAVQTVPGVREVALTSDMPFSRDRATNSVEPEGYRPADGEVIDVARRWASGNYFYVMRIPAIQGRTLGPADVHPGAERVMVVTDQFARHFWPDGRWLGRTVGFWKQRYRVVGVIADTREHDLRGDEDRFKFYVPARSLGEVGENLLLRTRIPTAQLLPMLRERIAGVDRAIVIEEAAPMQDRIARSLADARYRMRLMLVFSVTAACFSLLGIYGVMSRAVTRRRRELGLRSALGAPRRALLSLVLGDAARIGALGALLGIASALGATRVLAGLLWGVPRIDPLTYVGAAAALLALTLAAAVVPARRAAGVDVVRVMRD